MPDDSVTALRAVALVCSLKPSPAPSTSALMAEHVLGNLRDAGVKTESLRVVDHSVLPGVEADMFQGLNDIGFSIAAQGGTYWTGEAMQSKDYRDLDEVPEPVAKTTTTAARNAAHLAAMLRDKQYPPYQ